jgi:hypothetical protein
MNTGTRMTVSRLGLALVALSLLGATPAVKDQEVGENRCGWLVNPTPANYELVDREGRWLLSSQGGYQAPGIDDMPDMTVAGWVSDNGSYGHGCACLKVTTNKRSMKITRLLSSRALPLARCTADRTLPRP